MSAIPEALGELLRRLEYLHYPSKETKGVIRDLRIEIEALAQLKSDAEEGLLLALGIADKDPRAAPDTGSCSYGAVKIRDMTFDPIKMRTTSSQEMEHFTVWLNVGGLSCRLYAGPARYAKSRTQDVVGRGDRMVVELIFDTDKKIHSPYSKPNNEIWLIDPEHRTPPPIKYSNMPRIQFKP